MILYCWGGKIQTGENHVRQGLSKVFVFYTYSSASTVIYTNTYTSIKNNSRVTVNGTNVTHTDLCQKNFGCQNCRDISILFYFNSNYADVCNGNENGIKTKIEALTDDNVLSTLNLAIANPLASRIDIASILGGLEKDSKGEITGKYQNSSYTES